MQALVVCDSTFGNTTRIAQAIASGLGERVSTRIVSASAATQAPFAAPDLLLVGGPTQRRGLSPALRAFLDDLPRGSLRGVRAATFDTRYHMSALLSGSAAGQAAGQLRRTGCHLVVSPESFFMERDVPPMGEKRRHELERLEGGEVERAAEWGRHIAAQVQP
jgi:flavodoxin